MIWQTYYSAVKDQEHRDLSASEICSREPPDVSPRVVEVHQLVLVLEMEGEIEGKREMGLLSVL